MPNFDVAVITGSLRAESLSRKMGRALTRLPVQGMNLSILEIGDMPHYNEDLESNPPDAFTKFRAAVAAADAILFVTPEFNRSMPGVMKNAMDVGSRPWGKSVWNRKPAAVISMSPGVLGGFGAHHHLRQVLVAVNLVTMPHPEAYIGGAAKLFDSAGEPVDRTTIDFVTTFVEAFRDWIETQLRGR
jgi:chromate reductase